MSFLGTRIAIALIVAFTGSARCAPMEIHLPFEVNAFKQDVGAEIANAQCLICHSVEYVSTQPPFPRAFWKSSVQKMQQKYGAVISDAQIDPLVDYLTRNYGTATNVPHTVSTPPATGFSSIPPLGSDGPKIASKYGCLGCHNASTKLIGPAYKEIAAKYKTDRDAAEKIEQQIHKGGSGKWGPIIMPPFPQVTPTEVKLITDWILSLK